MKNTMVDLRNHLFATLEELTDPTPGKPVDLERAKTIATVAAKVIDSAKVEVDFLRVMVDAPKELRGTGFMTAPALEHKGEH